MVHRKCGFTHWKWVNFPWLCKRLPEGMCKNILKSSDKFEKVDNAMAKLHLVVKCCEGKQQKHPSSPSFRVTTSMRLCPMVIPPFFQWFDHHHGFVSYGARNSHEISRMISPLLPHSLYPILSQWNPHWFPVTVGLEISSSLVLLLPYELPMWKIPPQNPVASKWRHKKGMIPNLQSIIPVTSPKVRSQHNLSR